jgi:epoxide hydrolase 4
VEAYREETLGRDIAQLVEALGAESAKVVGHDWGGWAGWWAAMLHPERVERLAVLNVPYPIVFAHSRLKLSYRLIRADFRQRWPNWMSPSEVSVTRAIFRRALVKKGVMSEGELDRYVEAWRQPGGAPAIGAGSNVYTAQHRHRKGPIEQRCRPVSCPVLVIYGKEDQFIPAELATPPAEWVPNSRVEIVEGSDHWVQSEHPERVTEILLGFLSE